LSQIQKVLKGTGESQDTELKSSVSAYQIDPDKARILEEVLE